MELNLFNRCCVERFDDIMVGFRITCVSLEAKLNTVNLNYIKNDMVRSKENRVLYLMLSSDEKLKGQII